MAKATVLHPAPRPQPPPVIQLELSQREARALAVVFSRIGGEVSAARVIADIDAALDRAGYNFSNLDAETTEFRRQGQAGIAHKTSPNSIIFLPVETEIVKTSPPPSDDC